MSRPVLKPDVSPSAPAADSRREKRRNEIIAAAAKLFAEEGFSDCEMDRVASELHIAKGTLYLYFPGKQELFFAAVDLAMRQLQEAVRTAAATTADPFEQISRSVRAYLVFFQKNRHYVELLIQERAIFPNRKQPTYLEHRQAARVYWRELYGGLIAAGRFRSDLTVEQTLDAVGNLLYGTMFTNHFQTQRVDIDAQHKGLLDILFFGLLSPNERALQHP